MDQTVQPLATPVTPPPRIASAVPAPVAAPAQPQADVISPAEAKFWQEWAEKAWFYVKQQAVTLPVTGDDVPTRNNWRIIGVALGAAFAAASFSKYVPGKWKIATGGAAVGSALAGFAIGRSQDYFIDKIRTALPEQRKLLMDYGDRLQSDIALQKQFADYLERTVTKEDFQGRDMEDVMRVKVLEFGKSMGFFPVAPSNAVSR